MADLNLIFNSGAKKPKRFHESSISACLVKHYPQEYINMEIGERKQTNILNSRKGSTVNE